MKEPPEGGFLHFFCRLKEKSVTAERKIRIAEILSLVVCASGIAVIFGWIADTDMLKKSFLSAMVFNTAVLFVFLGAGFLCP